MGLVTRPSKAASGTRDYAANSTLTSTELNQDLNTIYDEFNGNVTNPNVNAAANIGVSKLDDYSVNATNQALVRAPGDSGAQVLPVALTQELETLRYQLLEIGLGADADRAAGALFWGDRPVRAPNLLNNPQLLFADAANLPDGWALSGTPTLALVADGTNNTLGRGQKLSIAATGAEEGIQQTLNGLKASTRYLVGCLIFRTVGAGNFHLRTTGAAAGTFTNLNLTESGALLTLVSGMIETTAVPADVVLQLRADDANTFVIRDAFVYECRDNWIGPFKPFVRHVQTTFVDAARFTAAAWTTVQTGVGTDLTVSVVVPVQGCQLVVSGSACVGIATVDTDLELRLRETVTNTVLDNAYLEMAIGAAEPQRATLRVGPVLADATPGATRTFVLEGRAGAGATGTVNPPGAVTGTLPRANLLVEVRG